MTYDIAVTDDFQACLDLRIRIFVDEQGIPLDEELDSYDETATHLLATDRMRPVGTARVILVDHFAKIGRICVLPETRGTGLGANLVKAAMAFGKDQPGITHAVLDAQVYAIGFYEKLGFVADGPEFDDGGIPHRRMERAL